MKNPKVEKVVSSKKNPRSFVFIIKDDLIQDDIESNKVDLVKLRHPKTDAGSYFAVNKKLYEIIKFSDEKRSYFIDDNVSSNGDLYLATPIDPLLLILPYLIKAKHCCPLDHILMDEEYPEIGRLLKCYGITSQLHFIANRKGEESLNAYIYNEEKTLCWLRKKINRIVILLENKGIHVSSSKAVSANFIKSEKSQESPESYLRYALGILGEYLPSELVLRLSDFMGLPPEEKKASVIDDENVSPKDKKKRETCDETENGENKKVKLDEKSEFKLDSPAVKVEKKQSAKEQARAKAAKGSKSISAFFKKK